MLGGAGGGGVHALGVCFHALGGWVHECVRACAFVCLHALCVCVLECVCAYVCLHALGVCVHEYALYLCVDVNAVGV